MTRLMIDLETLSSEKNAAIISIAAVEFGLGLNPTSATFFYQKIDPRDAERTGLHVDPATMSWWSDQDPAVRKESFSGIATTEYVFQQFHSWCVLHFGEDLSKIELWSKGSDFDLVVLPNAYYKVLGDYPFDFRNHRCHRTLENIAANIMPGEWAEWKHRNPQTEKHHALADARYQARVATHALGILGALRNKDAA